MMTEEHKHEEKKVEESKAAKKPARKAAPKKKEEAKVEVKAEAKSVVPTQVHAEHKPEHAAHVEHKPEHITHKPLEHKVEAKPAEVPVAKEKKARKKHAVKGGKALVVRGKRKESVARATITKGTGVLRFNKMNVDALNNKYMRDLIKQPLQFVGVAASNINISVTVNGGGVMGQVQAARNAIANALVAYFDDKAMMDRMLEFDRFMIIEDSRRVETKKYKGPKARARFQKSYR
jgi:small subunit ribosomal protein S9